MFYKLLTQRYKFYFKYAIQISKIIILINTLLILQKLTKKLLEEMELERSKIKMLTKLRKDPGVAALLC